MFSHTQRGYITSRASHIEIPSYWKSPHARSFSLVYADINTIIINQMEEDLIWSSTDMNHTASRLIWEMKKKKHNSKLINQDHSKRCPVFLPMKTQSGESVFWIQILPRIWSAPAFCLSLSWHVSGYIWRRHYGKPECVYRGICQMGIK